MVKLFDLKTLLEKIAKGGKVIHVHDRTYMSIRGVTQKELYDVLRSIDCSAKIVGGDMLAEYLGDVECVDECPSVGMIWKYKSWNTKWDKQEDGSYSTSGTLIYKDLVYDDVMKINVSMEYTVDGDKWKVIFMYEGEKFKSLVFKSTSERYAKTKMLNMSQKAFEEEFYKRDDFKSVYGDIYDI